MHLKQEQTIPILTTLLPSGGTSGSVLAARLAEDASLSILVIEAGQHNSLLENTVMVGGWSQNFDTEADWNITTEQNAGLAGRSVKVSRGKFLGGSSGVNGTLCIRGTKRDYDDWEMEGWDGEEVWGYMRKVSEWWGRGRGWLLMVNRRRIFMGRSGLGRMRRRMVMMVCSISSLMIW